MIKHRPAPKAPVVEGILQLKNKFGFVLSEDPAHADVMIQGSSLRLAMDGDRVRARILSSPTDARRSGEIIDVLVRSRQTVVGTFRRLGNQAVVVPELESAPVVITDMRSLVPHVGDIVTARVHSWPTLKEAAKATLAEVLGPRDAPGVDLQALIRKHELPDAFPPEAAAEAEAFGHYVPESAWRGRETFFNDRVFTIDGADAKDFDDAVSIHHTAHGWRLGVHIADVAEYVKEGTALDEESRRRGTSVYLSGTVLPMLPFPLSDNLCSLRPDTIRLTLTCLMDIDRQGRVTHARVFESAIRSVRRFTYEEVELLLRGGLPERVTPEVAADVRDMGALARLLREKRFSRGSLDFDFPEPEVVTDLKGRPTEIRRRERLEAHRLIEDFMLLANESVADYMKARPFLYRIHERPDPAKAEKLQKTLEVLGLRLPGHLNYSQPSSMQAVIRSSGGTPVQPMVHLLVLRSLKQAVYSPVNKGHFGLASPCYTHFTSPIRRYPDLIVHRLLKERLRGQPREAYWKKELPVLATHMSRRERAAVDAEREFMDIQRVRLMESRVGESFDGVISSVTNFGFFVQLTEFFVEGLVHITTLGSDFFIFDEARMTLRGRRTGRSFAIGQNVRVKLAAANILKHQLDFQLLAATHAGKPASPSPSSAIKHPQHSRRRRRRRH